MIVTPLKTLRVEPRSITLTQLLDEYVQAVPEGSVLAISSKIVSLCEGRVVPTNISKDDLIKQESSFYLPAEYSKYGFHFTITNNTLISAAGIDESNVGDNFVLWPSNAQQTANEVRQYLRQRFGLQQVGVVITDSTCSPMRLGTVGVSLAHSGFVALHSYVGEPDLFGRPFSMSRSNVAGGLAATATLAMGEGTEQTPLVLMSDMPFVSFENHDPTQQQLDELRVLLKDDLFAPFTQKAEWLNGDMPELV